MSKEAMASKPKMKWPKFKIWQYAAMLMLIVYVLYFNTINTEVLKLAKYRVEDDPDKFDPNKTVAIGDTGTEVIRIQAILNDKSGAEIPDVTIGIFDRATEAALMKATGLKSANFNQVFSILSTGDTKPPKKQVGTKAESSTDVSEL